MSAPQRVVLILSEDEVLRQQLQTSLATIGTRAFSVPTITELLSLIEGGRSASCILVDQGDEHSTVVAKTHSTLRQRGISTPIVLLARKEGYNQIVSAARLGVVAVVSKHASVEELEAAMQRAQQSRCLAEHEVRVHQLHRRIESMSDRERTVLNLASRGLPNKTIATRIGVSMKTVERDRRIAYSKLGVRSTAEMARQLTIVECHEFAANGISQPDTKVIRIHSATTSEQTDQPHTRGMTAKQMSSDVAMAPTPAAPPQQALASADSHFQQPTFS